MRAIRNFHHDQRGSVAIMFVVGSVMMILAIGIAIDSWQRAVVRNHVQNALDAAVLVGARANADKVGAAKQAFFSNLKTAAPKIEQSALKPAFVALPSGGISGQIDVDVDPFLVQVAHITPDALNVVATADFATTTSQSGGCIFLTDPKNTGLNMTGNSSMVADCSLQITTKNTAIELSGNASAEFQSICANGTIDAPNGNLTPNVKLLNCTPIVDPFAGLPEPNELKQACDSNNDLKLKNKQSSSLIAGVHCGEVVINSGGSLELLPGTHVFRGGLEIKNGAELFGKDVLIILVQENDDYKFFGNVKVSGLQSGFYRGFVMYHADYSGSSNTVDIGPKANVTLEGVIYLPNTNIDIKTNLNEFATRSILVTDRLEISGNGSFTASVTSTSPTPLPTTSLGNDSQTVQLIE